MGCSGSKPNDVANPAATGGGRSGGGSVVHKPGETCEQLWKFGKRLGSGAYSTVYLAKHKKMGEEVAVKKITKSQLQPYDHDALKDEVKLLSECKHPNIIRFVDFFDEAEYYFLLSEVVGGGELFDRICDKTTYTEAEARDLIITLLKVLAYLHKKNIAHRDLKPENLLLRSTTNDTDIVLADFGFAQVTKGRSLQQVCGTPDYVAPEVISHAKYDYSCDVWSAGVITFILLGGYPPFQAKDEDDRDALFAIIKKGKFKFHEKFWKTISPEAKDLITQMLTVDVDKRSTAEELLRHKWLGLSQEELRKSVIDTTALKEFNAKRKLKSVGKAVIGVNRMKNAVNAFGTPKP